MPRLIRGSESFSQPAGCLPFPGIEVWKTHQHTTHTRKHTHTVSHSITPRTKRTHSSTHAHHAVTHTVAHTTSRSHTYKHTRAGDRGCAQRQNTAWPKNKKVSAHCSCDVCVCVLLLLLLLVVTPPRLATTTR